MNSISRRRNRRGKRGNVNNPITALVKLIASSHHSAANADVLSVAQDLVRRVPNWQLTQNPPKNFLNQIHWIQDSSNTSISVSSSVPTYVGYSFQANTCTLAAALCSYFDQYCIWGVYIRLYLPYSSTTSPLGTMVTAIDYDNVAALGSYAAYLDFSNANESGVICGKSYERFFQPIPAGELYSGSAAAAYGMTRCWVDSAGSTIPHYGFRAAFTGATAAVTMYVSTTIVYGFRNNF